MFWPRMASICISMTMTLWTMVTPSKTTVIFAIPAMSKDEPPTPETLVLVLCRGGRLGEGILWNAARDKTVTVAPVSIKKFVGVPSMCPWIKIPFSHEPGPGIGDDASESCKSWLPDDLDEENENGVSPTAFPERAVTLAFLWCWLTSTESLAGRQGRGPSCPTKLWSFSLMGESFPDGNHGFLNHHPSIWGSWICSVPSRCKNSKRLLS